VSLNSQRGVLERVVRWPRHRWYANAKKTKPREQIRWRVSLITKTPAKFIDFVYAPDAAAAEKQVAEEHEIPDTLRDRVVAIHDDL
jgi:hypothetical protein